MQVITGIESQIDDGHLHISYVMRKPVFGVFDQVRQKQDCTATEYGYRLENSELESRGTVLSMW